MTLDLAALRARHRQVDSCGRPHRYCRFCENEEEHRPTTVLWPCDAILAANRIEVLEAVRVAAEALVNPASRFYEDERAFVEDDLRAAIAHAHEEAAARTAPAADMDRRLARDLSALLDRW